MKLNNLKTINEVSYIQNLGVEEMFRFFQKATDKQKEQMKQLIAKKAYNAAWKLLQQVLNTTLYPLK